MIDGVSSKLSYMKPTLKKPEKLDVATSSAPAGEQAKVELASTSSAGSSNAAPIDRAKIAAIRNAIRNNAYPIDFQKLADRMIEADLVNGSDRQN